MREKIEPDEGICESYDYNHEKEKAFCYFKERYLDGNTDCPCMYYSVKEPEK